MGGCGKISNGIKKEKREKKREKRKPREMATQKRKVT